MLIDITKIRVATMPKATTFLTCSNGSFVLNEDGVLKIRYKRDIDQDKVLELNEEFEALQKALKLAQDTFEIADIKSQISRCESQLRLETTPERFAPCECRFNSQADIYRWLELARSANSDSVWSCAYKTGWRPDSPDNDNPDLELRDCNTVVYPREWIYTGRVH